LNILDVAALGIAFCLFVGLLRKPKRNDLPAGPKGLPVIGNLFDMPASHEWLTFAKWKEQWGDMVSLNILGQPMIILNSAKHAIALLERRSAIYSDRPTMPVAGDFVGWARTLVLCPYGPRFRELRRLFSQLMGTKDNMARFVPMLQNEEGKFLLNLWKDKSAESLDVSKHIRRTAGAIILDMAYGYKIKGENDPLVHTVDHATEEFALATAPGAFLADIFPFLMRVPDWMPGAEWKRKTRKWGQDFDDMCDVPYEYVKNEMAAGTASPSFTSLHLESGIDAEREHTVKMAAASIYSGGADTTVSAIGSFFLAMMLHPEIQTKAKAEIDAVIGNDRLPTYADRESLPYVEALYKEVVRWNPIGPLGVPHRLIQDDAYEGYAFPKGTVFIANIWQFTHDAETYANPLTFDPHRYLPSDRLKEPEQDPRTYAFGFGRRVCPGVQLADASVWLACVMNLAVFDITQAPGKPPMRLEDVQYTTGTISHPPPFECCVRPRSLKAEGLLRSLEGSVLD